MKVALASVLFACAILAPAAARADISVGVYADIPGQPVDSVDEFYGELAPYGSWVEDPQLGAVFIPAEEDYVPYTNGHWEYTDVGLVWISDEPFAWATSHYGRWFFDDAYGRWAWMPDTEWGPSWVQWSEYGNEYGWAPLPPRGYEAPIYAWHYAPAHHLFDADLYRYYEPRQRVWNIHRYARNVPQYREWNNRRIVAGPPVQALQQHHVYVQPHRLEPRQIGRFAPGQQPRPQPNMQARSPRDFQNRQPIHRPQYDRGQPRPQLENRPAPRPQLEYRPQPAPRTVEPARRPQFENRQPIQRSQPQPRPVEPARRPQFQPRPQAVPPPQPAPRAQVQPRPQPPMHVAPQVQARPAPQAPSRPAPQAPMRPAPQAAQHAAPQAQQHAAPQAPPAQSHAAPPAERGRASSDRRDRH